MLDKLFNILNNIWRYKFFENEYVTKIFNGAIIVACSWLVLKVVIELIMNYIVKNEERSSPLSVYRGIVLAIVMMFLITPLFQFGYKFSTSLTDAVISVSGMESNTAEAEGTISKSIIRAMVYEDSMDAENIDYLVENYKTIDINDTDGDYYFYALNFLMLVVTSFVTIFLLIFIGLQLAKRVMELALYKIVGPFCCTSLTNNNSKSFEVWCKSTIGLFLITVVQFIGLGLLLNLFGNAFSDTNLFTGIFLIIGALLFIISSPTIISSLLDQNAGLTTAMGDIQSLSAMGSAVRSGMSFATNVAGFALSKGANVMSSAGNLAKGGVTSISNMLNKSKTLTPEQSSVVKTSLSNNNPRQAYNQVGDFLKENRGMTTNKSNVINTNSSNNLIQPYNMRINPIRNQYLNSNQNNNLNNINLDKGKR